MKNILATVAVFDAGIGLLALIAPEKYIELVHGLYRKDELGLVRRTGVVWLFFASASVLALRQRHKPNRWAEIVAALHLMDAAADLAYVKSARILSPLGKRTVSVMPALNTAIALTLTRNILKAS